MPGSSAGWQVHHPASEVCQPYMPCAGCSTFYSFAATALSLYKDSCTCVQGITNASAIMQRRANPGCTHTHIACQMQAAATPLAANYYTLTLFHPTAAAADQQSLCSVRWQPQLLACITRAISCQQAVVIGHITTQYAQSNTSTVEKVVRGWCRCNVACQRRLR